MRPNVPGSRVLVTLGAVALLGLGACEDRGPTEDTEHRDVGQACLSGEPGGSHLVEIDFFLCLSSSCDDLVGSSCTATLEGDTITIESEATVRSRTGPFTACTSDCRSVEAECETPPLAAGTYTLAYGDVRSEFVVAETAEPEPEGPNMSRCIGAI